MIMAAIVFTTAIAIVLISTGDLSTLADTTVVLLLFVVTIVNVAVLVLRRERVEHEHFHAPSVFPVLGAVISVALLVDTALDDASVFLRAAILLAVGAALWVVNRLVAGAHGPQVSPDARDRRVAPARRAAQLDP